MMIEKDNVSNLLLLTKNVFVKRTSEVNIKKLPVIKSKAKHLASKMKIVQVVRIDGGITVRLECTT